MLNKLKRFDLLKSLYYEDANLIHETEKMIKTMQENLTQMRDIQQRISNLLEISVVEIQNHEFEQNGQNNKLNNKEENIASTLPDIPQNLIGDFPESLKPRAKAKAAVKGLTGFRAKVVTES